MRTINISVVALILSSFSLAQNWFPTEVGNKLLQKSTVYNVLGNVRHFYLIEIKRDSIINGQKYFLVNSSDYLEGLEYANEWFRYDQDSQKVYRRVLDTSVVYMDFNLNAGQEFLQYDPISHHSTLRTVFESTIQMFGNAYSVKGFNGEELSTYMRKWILDFGIEPLGINDKRMEQILLFPQDDTLYYKYNYYPNFNQFTPILETSTYNFEFDFWIDHPYNQNNGSVFVDFIDSIFFECFYKSVSDSIYYGWINANTVYYPYVTRRVSFNLNSSLLLNGYSFYYKVIAKDKSLIPNYRSKPDTGYYKLIYDPSPPQILFSQDSIYVPTLSDSGSVKIINTSDHSVRIDSIISVGSFYGYWGNFTRPGFQYPFYLFQTMPGFMGDTLGIVIPPHDSINVSFSNVDLCPVCDYEIQDYFEDTLRFVFTFLDGNVYSFSKTIPISGEGHMSDVGDEEILPKEFSLSQNYPNPFNPGTNIHYSIGSRQFVTLKVYDVLGNEVAILVNEEKPAGSYEIEFKSSVGSHQLASGVYYYQLKAGEYLETKKMIYLK